jgi:hypothetical protein
MNYKYELIKEHPIRIRELPLPRGQGYLGYLHHLQELKTNDFFESIISNNIFDSLVRTKKWVEENYPELML